MFKAANLAFGHGIANARDEAIVLTQHALKLPRHTFPAALKVTAPDATRVLALFERRISERKPAAYLTREAWLGDQKFYVDERVIVPRSYIAELLLEHDHPLLPPPGKVRTALDLCTGSGCLAVLLAKQFPQARVDATDLSPAALEVAAINVRRHRLGRRLHLYQGDLLAALPAGAMYDVLLSNPPYEPSALVDGQAPEFAAEPRLAHDGGRDGLDLIRRLVRGAAARLKPHGILVLEIGGLRPAIDREFAALQPHWLPTEDGTDSVCLFHAARLGGRH